MSHTDSLAARIAARRLDLGISKREAARLAGIPRPCWVRYEAGDRIPTLVVLARIARVLGTTPETMIHGLHPWLLDRPMRTRCTK